MHNDYIDIPGKKCSNMVMKKLSLAIFFALPVFAEEVSKKEPMKVQIQPTPVQVVGDVNVNIKRPFRATVGVFARTSFGKSVITLPDENSYRMTDYSNHSGVAWLAYDINRTVLKKANSANNAKKITNGKNWRESYNDAWDTMDIEEAKKSLDNLSPERAFTGGVFLETLSDSDSPLKVGTSVAYAYKSELEYRFILGYQHKDYFIKIGYSFDMVGMKYDGKYQDQQITFTKDGFGSAFHVGVDYKLNAHIDVFGEYSYADIGLLNYHRISVGLKHYVY